MSIITNNIYNSQNKQTFSFPMNTVPCGTKEELRKRIAEIAAHITEGKDFAVQVTPACPEPQFTATDRQEGALTLPVLDALTKISLKALELGISSEENDFEVIADYCSQIIKVHPVSQDPIAILRQDVSSPILRELPCHNLARFRTVTTLWNEPCYKAQIEAINTRSLSVKEVLGKNFTAAQAVDLFIKHPHRSLLTFADFTGFNDFDNACLERLTKNCPNLRHLSIPYSRISGDALKHLEHVKGLLTLNIKSCYRLESDALKHLKHVKGLQSLNIAHCYGQEADALKHLEHVTGLQSLNIAHCYQLEADALKHLEHVKNLLSLNTRNCYALKPDALKHLEHVKGLLALNIESCVQLEPDALKHLEHVKGLQSLNIENSYQLEADALKHLEHVRSLQNLLIVGCHQLEYSESKLLEQLRSLQRLEI